MDYITTIEMSKIWGISSRRISLLCSQGRVPGAEKKGKTWLIPKDAVKPTDPRKKNRDLRLPCFAGEKPVESHLQG